MINPVCEDILLSSRQIIIKLGKIKKKGETEGFKETLTRLQSWRTDFNVNVRILHVMVGNAAVKYTRARDLKSPCIT